MVAGLVQETSLDSQSGYPGLANIPILIGRLSQPERSPEHDSSEVLLVLKPHLTTLAPWEFAVPKSIWVGTETRPLTYF